LRRQWLLWRASGQIFKSL